MLLICLVWRETTCETSGIRHWNQLTVRLDLFFSGMRVFGQEFHIPRFFAQ